MRPVSWLARIGASVLGVLQILGEIALLFLAICRRLPGGGRTRERVVRQMVGVGVRTLPLASVVSLFVGMVLVLQTADQLERYTQEILGSLVGLAMTKELGPVIMGFLLAGRAGSAVAAEIGSMNVYDEVNALRTMDIDPIAFLAVPRFLAMTAMLPVLVLYADVIGILGGAVVVIVDPAIKISPASYFENLFEWINLSDVVVGLLKGMAFGMTVAIVSCAFGLRTRGGAEGVATSTTAAVVWSFGLILALDYLIVRVALGL